MRNCVVAATRVLLLAASFAQAASAQDAASQNNAPAAYQKWCSPCHAPGPGHPGTQSLEIKYKDSLPAVLEQRTDLTAELVKTMVRQGVLMMAPFRKTEVSDAELDLIAAYLAK
jgi:mono/diheme cytochrome c family protein